MPVKDYAVWRRLGDLTTTSLALGLHRDGTGETAPFALNELRRRIFSSSYHKDKALATIFGRPPQICKVYCRTPAPLDVSDEYLFSSSASYDNVELEVDENGWSRSGMVQPATWLRLRYLMSRLREDILELAHSAPCDDLEARVE